MLCVVYPEDHSTFAFTHELISVNMNYMVNAFHQIRLNENIICMMLSCRFLATVGLSTSYNLTLYISTYSLYGNRSCAKLCSFYIDRTQCSYVDMTCPIQCND